MDSAAWTYRASTSSTSENPGEGHGSTWCDISPVSSSPSTRTKAMSSITCWRGRGRWVGGPSARVTCSSSSRGCSTAPSSPDPRARCSSRSTTTSRCSSSRTTSTEGVTAGAALRDVKVVDLTQIVSGAVTTMLLADFGADVVKIEPPDGEPYRSAGHAIQTERGLTNLNIMRFSRGKRSVTLNLKSQGGRDVFEQLLADADVLVENFRAGVLARLGYDAERLRALNPRLVYTTVSGFGHTDLYPSAGTDPPTYAITAEALGGLMHLCGGGGDDPPQWMGFAMTDIFAGTLAFAGTLMALRERDRTGRGRRVDIAMLDAAAMMNDLSMAMYSVLGEVAGPGQYSLQAPWGPYRTVDGFVAIAVLSPAQWTALCDLVGHPDLATDPRLTTGRDRAKHHDELVRPAIEDWTARQPKAAASDRLLARGIPSAPVNTAADVMNLQRLAERDMFIEVEEPVVGRKRLVGNPIKVEGLANRGESVRIPRLGEHTEEVLSEELGYSRELISQLRDVGAL
ncbi:MAG: CoA transferase [Nitriliruptorales bacterium]|nr:CoA transferase [Nitriliruptorales bacterium]